jgi:hypothetical protein
MANVLPADLRARGFAVTTMIMHLLGDAASPWLIGVASDSVGLRVPVLVTGAMLALAGVVLLAGRRTLERDMRALALPGPRLTLRSDSPGRSTVWSRRAVGPARR